MSSLLQTRLAEVTAGQILTMPQMQELISTIMDGGCEPLQIAGLLCAIATRGETADELAGAAAAMRSHATLIRQDGTGILDTCGTGGSGLKTFNISTAAAIVCAAAGVPIAKHGNRSISSTTGSADVLETLGVNINLTPAQVDACINEVGIGFCYAPLLHQAMKHVGPIRKTLGIRTMFNLLGPLTNPARAEFQVLGTIRNSYAEKMAHALAQLGIGRAVVLCGNNELDEICLWGPTELFTVENGTVTTSTLQAGQFAQQDVQLSDLQVDTATQSAALIKQIFAGASLPASEVVIANAAAGLWISRCVESYAAGVEMARETINSRQAEQKLQQLVGWSNSAS